MSIANVAAMSLEKCLDVSLEDAPPDGTERLKRQARDVWGHAMRVQTLSGAWRAKE